MSVTNDLVTDQRVIKVCNSLVDWGYDVFLIGRLLPDSLSIPDWRFKCQRIKLVFNTGFLFYAEFNIRLFFKLLFVSTDIYHSNDLDTLSPNYLVSKIRRKRLVYDSHEYFCGVPELVNRPFIQRVWRMIESFIFPNLKNVVTVNNSIASLYQNDYGIKPEVVRNVPKLFHKNKIKTRDELGISENEFVLILQGAGINVDRGAEEALLSLKYLSNVKLLIVGGGDVLQKLKNMAIEENLIEKVIFIPKMPYEALRELTPLAELGLTLDKDSNLNYKYSLPNKVFDYIHCRVPILSSNLPELKAIVETYEIGWVIKSHDPKEIASIIQFAQSNKEILSRYKNNCIEAIKQLNWEIESITLKKMYDSLN